MIERRVVGNYGAGTVNFFKRQMMLEKLTVAERKLALIKQINKIKGV